MEKQKVAVIDIDGVLADYRLGLLFWIRQSIPALSQKTIKHLQTTDTWINHHTMDLTYKDWLKTLEMFRMSGGKQSIPVYEGAKELLDLCHANDLEVVLLTSRPIDIYSNIYRDTVEWLENNNLKYDKLLWSKSKAEMIYKMRLCERVSFAIDDELHHIHDYSALDISTFWINLYNKQEIMPLNNCVRVNKLTEVVERLEKIYGK